MSRSLVHTYLGDRRGLLDAVQVRIVARLDAWVGHGLRRTETADEALRAIVVGTFAFVAAEHDGWSVLVSTGGLDHPALHGTRSRWAAALTADGGRELDAQLALAGLLGGVGAWVNRGVEASDVLARLRALLASAPSDAERGAPHGGD